MLTDDETNNNNCQLAPHTAMVYYLVFIDSSPACYTILLELLYHKLKPQQLWLDNFVKHGTPSHFQANDNIFIVT